MINSPVSRQLVNVAKRHRNLVAKGLRKLDVHIGQDLVLHALQHAGPMSQKELAEYLDVEQATITGISGRLREKGLIKRIPKKDDKRYSILDLTKKGLGVSRSIDVIWSELEEQMLEGLNQSERKKLLDALKLLSDSLYT